MCILAASWNCGATNVLGGIVGQRCAQHLSLNPRYRVVQRWRLTIKYLSRGWSCSRHSSTRSPNDVAPIVCPTAHLPFFLQNPDPACPTAACPPISVARRGDGLKKKKKRLRASRRQFRRSRVPAEITSEKVKLNQIVGRQPFVLFHRCFFSTYSVDFGDTKSSPATYSLVA